MRLSEGRVHSGFRVHHVRTEDAKCDDLASNGGGYESRKTGVNGALAPDLPVDPIPHGIGLRHKRLMR